MTILNRLDQTDFEVFQLNTTFLITCFSITYKIRKKNEYKIKRRTRTYEKSNWKPKITLSGH